MSNRLLYIDTFDELVAFVDRAQRCDVIAIDTEFLRERTYYAKLCLVQIAAGDEIALIDPFAIDDLTPLAHLFEDESIMKVFHAGNQDIEILHRKIGAFPIPIFDTQIAAALLGYSHQVGLGSLVGSVCGVSIKKGDSFTDWAARPLAPSQLEYAAEDVIYLPELYRSMKESLEDKGRLEWLEADFDELVDPDKYEAKPRERYKRLKRANQLNPRQLAYAREIAAWREDQAQMRDIPRKWVLTDEQIVETCKRDPDTIDDLFLIRGIKEKLSVADARYILELMRKANRLTADELPSLNHENSNEPNVDSAVDLMLALVRLRSKESGIAMQTLASHADLAELARGHAEDSELLKGWRRHIIGDELLALLNGDVFLALSDNELTVCKDTSR